MYDQAALQVFFEVSSTYLFLTWLWSQAALQLESEVELIEEQIVNLVNSKKQLKKARELAASNAEAIELIDQMRREMKEKGLQL